MKIIEKIASVQKKFYSLEFFPPKDKASWPEFFATVEKLQSIDPLFASVTYGAGGGTQDNTLAITAAIKKIGIEPMAHLTCVGATPEHLKSFLGALQKAEVHNILALRGDPPQNVEWDWANEKFKYASDLVAFVKKEFSDFGIGVAAYPTPHPQSPSFAKEREFTKLKLDMGSDFAITQLFFDPREYFEFAEQMKAKGISKPIIPGVLPVQSLASLRRVLSLSGCNMPAKLYLALEEADKQGGNEAVKKAGIAFAIEQIRQLVAGGAPGIHLYTLNQADTCLSIVKEVGKL